MYAKKWEKKRQHPEKFQRNPCQSSNSDRLWLHKHLREPVLDVGCGTCQDAESFKDYVGLDITRSFLRAAHFTFGVSEVIRGDARRLPFRDKVFETTFSKDVLVHYPQEEGMKIIWEMIRVGRRTYVAWGLEHPERVDELAKRGLRPEGIYNFIPGKPVRFKNVKGFHYNRYDLTQLEKHFKIIPVGDGTSITFIKPL